MPRKEGNRGINVTMSEGELEEVHTIARKRGYKITSDYLRSLIEADARVHGETFTFDVKRGGWRERKAEKQP